MAFGDGDVEGCGDGDGDGDFRPQCTWPDIWMVMTIKTIMIIVILY